MSATLTLEEKREVWQTAREERAARHKDFFFVRYPDHVLCLSLVSGQEYPIDEHGCRCSDKLYRHPVHCKHEAALVIAYDRGEVH